MDLLTEERTLKIRDLNPHIVCGLCAGYYVDATTIAECLHTFCKSCIVKYLQTSKHCPACGILIHETQPLSNIMLDRTIQVLVEKLVPNLVKTESQRQADFYSSTQYLATGSAEDVTTVIQPKVDFSQARGGYRDETQVPLQIELHKSQFDDEDCEALHEKVYNVLGSCRLRIGNVEKLMHRILGLQQSYKVEILCQDEAIAGESTLKYVYICYWKEKSLPMCLHFRIVSIPQPP